jgi:chaperonin GroEL
MAKNITFDEEMRKSLMKGVEQTVDAVAQTLGPAGRTVLIENSYGPATVTRDGVTVAKAIELSDPLENMGAQLIKNIASQTDENVGDGTTTSSVLAKAILEEGVKAVSTGVNPIKLRNGMNEAVKDVVTKLKEMAQEIDSKDQITRVAEISANNDPVIGSLIADAIEKVGSDGVITVGESKTTETYIDFVEGMSFDRGYISPYFCTNSDNLTTEYEEPLILVTDKKLGNIQDFMPLLEKVVKTGKQFLIIAPEVEGDLLTTLLVNSLRGLIKVCAVKAPGFGDRQKDMLEDIAILTGATMISEDLGTNLKDVSLNELGSASSIKVTKDRTTIIGGEGDSDEIKSRIAQLRTQVGEATSDYDKEKLQERLARLAGGVAVINIGDVSEAAAKEKKYRVEDAINAVRAAIEEGIIPGGGTTLCQIASKLKTPTDADADWLRGYNIVIKALSAPVKQIALNAGLAGEVIADKVASAKQGKGFNALTGKIVDMITEGVIDPVKVTRCALENAASVASLVLTSGASITTIPESKTSVPAAPSVPMM